MAATITPFKTTGNSPRKTSTLEKRPRFAVLKAVVIALAFIAAFHASAAPLLYGDTNACAGSRGLTYNATGFGAIIYSWNLVDNTSGATFSPVPLPTDTTVHVNAGPSGGSFRIELTVTGGIASGQTFFWKTLVSAIPPVTVSSDVSICAGSPTTLTASGADTYSWSPATGLSATTGPIVTANPASTTVYTVTGFSPDGCPSSAMVTVTVNQSVVTCPPNYTNTAWRFTPPSSVCGYSQKEWSERPHRNNLGSILTTYFGVVYGAGFVEVGLTGGTGNFMKFTSPAAIEAYLPASGTPAALNASLVNPASSTAGAFGGEVLALRLNVDFSDAGVASSPTSPLGNLVLINRASPLNGRTVRQILAIANIALGGGDVSSYGMTIRSLDELVENLNQAFDECETGNWARENLISLPAPAQSGLATATSSCGTSSSASVSYSDSAVPDPVSGGYIVTRTWQAVDSSGNSSDCVQFLALSDRRKFPEKGDQGDADR